MPKVRGKHTLEVQPATIFYWLVMVGFGFFTTFFNSKGLSSFKVGATIFVNGG